MDPPDQPMDDLSVHELIDGPTEVISAGDLAAVRDQDPSGYDVSVETTQDMSGLHLADDRTQDLSGRVARARIELPRMPAAGALYRRALLGSVPGLGGRRAAEPPAVELTVAGVAVDLTHLADYDRVCGFRLTDRLPATFPHVMGFPLALRLMTTPEFPIPLTGVVHVANRITVQRSITADETLDFTTYAENLRPHDRGRQIDVVLVGSVDGEEVWRGVSTYLGKERTAVGSGRRDQGDRPPALAGSAHWRVEPAVGTAYARVSGDHNPIHTSRLGARLLGFPRPIAHGMWSKAHCLAALENRLPDAYTVDVAFKLPVPLPSTVSFSVTPAGEFTLHDLRGRPHLTGSVQG